MIGTRVGCRSDEGLGHIEAASSAHNVAAQKAEAADWPWQWAEGPWPGPGCKGARVAPGRKCCAW